MKKTDETQYSLADAAEFLEVSTRTLYNYIDRGILPQPHRYKFRRNKFYYESELNQAKEILLNQI